MAGWLGLQMICAAYWPAMLWLSAGKKNPPNWGVSAGLRRGWRSEFPKSNQRRGAAGFALITHEEKRMRRKPHEEKNA
jgi:hypothetical protein